MIEYAQTVKREAHIIMVEFYEKHGLKQIARFMDENGEECLTMLKES